APPPPPPPPPPPRPLRRSGHLRRLPPRACRGGRAGGLAPDLRQARLLRLRRRPRRRDRLGRQRPPPAGDRRRTRGHPRRAVAAAADRAVRRGPRPGPR